jgi:hypothetical protein
MRWFSLQAMAQKYTQYMDNIRREALRQEQQNSPGTVQ